MRERPLTEKLEIGELRTDIGHLLGFLIPLVYLLLSCVAINCTEIVSVPNDDLDS